MKILDLKKDMKYLYSPSARQVATVQVPKLQFAMVDGTIEKGQGPSTSPGFQEATSGIYGIAYTLKFTLKKRKADPIDYPVMPLEGLWWIEGGAFDITIKDNWKYTLMILLPEPITKELFEVAVGEVSRKRGDNPALTKLRLAVFEEGLCMQVMHIGPYADEPVTVEKMKTFARENGYSDRVGAGGKHHEIYLGDPGKADPSKLKTVLRHPLDKIKA